MCTGLFTVAAVDNLDYNPSATTAKDSFHGTGISLMQHPSHIFEGHDRGVLIIDQTIASHGKRITPLPEKYTNVLPAAFKMKEFTVPHVNNSVQSTNFNVVDEETKEEWKWLEVVKNNLNKNPLQNFDWITWSAYHSNLQTAVIPPAAINALLPLFLDSAHSVAMVKHSMEVVRAAVQYLNPGQIPVLSSDQPLYALAKQIQWAWPNDLGEDHFVQMLGGLHIEMAILKVYNAKVYMQYQYILIHNLYVTGSIYKNAYARMNIFISNSCSLFNFHTLCTNSLCTFKTTQ